MTTPTTPSVRLPHPPDSFDSSDRDFDWPKLLATVLVVAYLGMSLLLMLTQEESLLLGCIAFVGFFPFGFVVATLHQWKSGRRVAHGWKLLEEGFPEQAVPYLEEGTTDSWGVGQRAWNRYGLSLAWLHQGEYGRALAYCHEVTRYWERKPNHVLRLLAAPALMATLHALRGEQELARTWVEAMQQLPYNRTDYALLAQAVMLCRAGKYEEAVRRIQDTPQEHVPKRDVDAVRVLHAFARNRLGTQQLPLRPGCVLPVKPARGAEYAWLAREWPELATFLG